MPCTLTESNLDSHIIDQYTKINCISIQGNEQSNNENKKTIPFTITSKRTKQVGVNLTKEGQDIYNGNYKASLEEIFKDLSKWKDISCSWIGRLNIVKVAVIVSFMCQLDQAIVPSYSIKH